MKIIPGLHPPIGTKRATTICNAHLGFSGSTPSAPYDVSWQIQGDETSYKLATNNFAGGTLLQLSVIFAGIYPGIANGGGVFSQNILGCVSLALARAVFAG